MFVWALHSAVNPLDTVSIRLHKFPFVPPLKTETMQTLATDKRPLFVWKESHDVSVTQIMHKNEWLISNSWLKPDLGMARGLS